MVHMARGQRKAPAIRPDRGVIRQRAGTRNQINARHDPEKVRVAQRSVQEYPVVHDQRRAKNSVSHDMNSAPTMAGTLGL